MGVDAAAWSHTVGMGACLVAASLWAVSVQIFRAPIVAHGARTVNLAKCVIGTLLQGATIVVAGQHLALATAPGRSLAFVAVSGLVGLVVGDTALFSAVARIGASRTLLLQTLVPVFTALIAVTFQAERLSGRQAIGGLLVLAGVALVVAPGRARTMRHAWSAAGVVLGALAALGQAGGIVLAKQGMEHVPYLAASFVRLLAASLGLALVAAAGGRMPRLLALARDAKHRRRVVPAALLGTYLALFLMMAGVALAPAAVAAVLLSTSPVFSLLLDAVTERQPVPARAIVGTLVAIAGVAVLATA